MLIDLWSETPMKRPSDLAAQHASLEAKKARAVLEAARQQRRADG